MAAHDDILDIIKAHIKPFVATTIQENGASRHSVEFVEGNLDEIAHKITDYMYEQVFPEELEKGEPSKSQFLLTDEFILVIDSVGKSALVNYKGSGIYVVTKSNTAFYEKK